MIIWWFSTSRGLRKMTTWYCYKMKIGFYHEVTWRGNSTTTKWRLVLSSSYLKGTLHHYKMKIGFYHLHVFIIGLLEGNTSTLQNTLLTCFNMLLSEGQLALLQFEIRFIYMFFYMLSSDGQIPLLQNDFRFLQVFQLPKRWKLIKWYKMQFPSCGHKMPGPTPFWHLNS